MKTFFFLVLIMICSFSIAQQNKYFSTSGKEIIAPNGKPFLIKGINLGNWLMPEGYMFGFANASSPRLINDAISELIGPASAADFWKRYLGAYITQQDVHYIKLLGMNSIRVPFNYRMFTRESYMGLNDENRGFRLLDSLVNWCRAERLYIILDMHAAPGGQTGDNIDDGYGYPFLFDDLASQQLTINIWQRIATHYKNEPVILGYDLLNEPIATHFDTTHFNPLLEPLYKKITAAIRQTDTHHLLFVGGAQWDSDFFPFGKPFDNELVYTFHKYWTDTAQQVIQQYLDFRDKNKVPIYCGETGENTNAWNAGFRRLLEKENIGWHFWPYKKMNNERCIISFAQPVLYDSIINYTEKDRSSFEKIRNAQPKDKMAAKKALDDFLINCSFKNCMPNKSYIQSLGLKSE